MIGDLPAYFLKNQDSDIWKKKQIYFYRTLPSNKKLLVETSNEDFKRLVVREYDFADEHLYQRFGFWHFRAIKTRTQMKNLPVFFG